MIFSDTDVDEADAVRDLRSEKDFVGITFSNHKLTEVKKAWMESMVRGDVESAMNWSVEMMLSHHNEDLWKLYVEYFCTYLRSEPVRKYMGIRRATYENIRKERRDLRNDSRIRYMHVELLSVLLRAERRPPRPKMRRVRTRSPATSTHGDTKDSETVATLKERLKQSIASGDVYLARSVLHDLWRVSPEELKEYEDRLVLFCREDVRIYEEVVERACQRENSAMLLLSNKSTWRPSRMELHALSDLQRDMCRTRCEAANPKSKVC
jgi:hypothetical protein